jgi:hypothetical protein
MRYTNSLKNKGFKILFRKTNFDDKGYDLYLNASKSDSYYESFFSMSNSLGYYFTYDSFDCVKEGCEWNLDDFILAAEYLGTEKLIEID